MTSTSTVSILIERAKNKNLANILSILTGLAVITLLAQIAIPLPWTPVPITGQTFGVTLVALSWGWKRASVTMGAYLILGSLGLPLFASVGALGASSGYLVGMLLSACIVGYLAETGWTDSFFKALTAAYIGSALVLGTGVLVLSYFTPTEALLAAGVLPFLPGDFIKNYLAASIATKLKNSVG